MLAHAIHPVRGMLSALAGDNTITMDAGRCLTADAPAPSPFGQLVALYQSNEYLLLELKTVAQKLSHARESLATPGMNSVLAQAHIDHLRSKHSAVLIVLRAN